MVMKHVFKVTTDERERMEQIVSKGRHPAWQVQRAYALLKLDRGPQGPGWNDQRVAEAYSMTVRCLESSRKRSPRMAVHNQSEWLCWNLRNMQVTDLVFQRYLQSMDESYS